MTAGIVIVGAGHCGVNAALAAREAGYDGPITLIGDDPELPYERPPLSKWNASGPTLRPLVAPEIFGKELIQLRRGDHVTMIERDTCRLRLRSGELIPYARLLLATGAAPRRIDPQNWPSAELRYLRSYADAQSLARDLAPGSDVIIIGGGFIGLELAASLTERGVYGHVVEAQDRVLARAVPPEISQKVSVLHTARGVTVHTRTTIASMEGRMAYLSNGQTVRADHVIVGIGSVPNTELAVSAGLPVDDGIVVDEHFATSDANIFASGDCCTSPVGISGLMRLESWQAAGDQGRRVGQIMAGTTPEPTTPPWFWSDQFDHGLQAVGVPTQGSTRVVRHLSECAVLCAELLPGGLITYAAGLAPGYAIGREIKLIQKLMDARVPVCADMFADPDISLKSILRGGS